MTTAIITGASRGLGRALAELLAERGWNLVIDGRDPSALAAAAAAFGPSTTAIAGDIADPRHRSALVDAAGDTGSLDLVVNNASELGPSPLPRLAALDLDALRRIQEVNVVAPLGLIQLALPLLAAATGAIVNVTSDAAVEPYEGWGGYGSSKAGLEQLSNVLAAEHPELRIWWVDPGDMRTDMHQAAFPGEDISDRPLPSAVAPSILELLDARPPSGRRRGEVR